MAISLCLFFYGYLFLTNSGNNCFLKLPEIHSWINEPNTKYEKMWKTRLIIKKYLIGIFLSDLKSKFVPDNWLKWAKTLVPQEIGITNEESHRQIIPLEAESKIDILTAAIHFDTNNTLVDPIQDLIADIDYQDQSDTQT